MSNSELRIQRLGYSLGARVTGIDLSAPISDEDLAAIREAWTRHLVLVFPEQDLTPETLVSFTRHFGRLDDYASQPFNRLPGHDEVMLLTNRKVAGKLLPGAVGGQNWHTDLSYTLRPASTTHLYCVERPELGGDTMFANMYDAFETLSSPLQRFLESLEAVHDVALISAKRDPAVVAEFRRLNPPVIHPAVRVHPDSGRKALYINDRVRTFVGMTERESQPLIRFLCEHSITPRFVYRHRWETRDVVLWDNRCLTHLAVGDYEPNEIRYMIRTSCIGEHEGRFESPQAAEVRSPAAAEALAAGVSAMHD